MEKRTALSTRNRILTGLGIGMIVGALLLFYVPTTKEPSPIPRAGEHVTSSAAPQEGVSSADYRWVWLDDHWVYVSTFREQPGQENTVIVSETWQWSIPTRLYEGDSGRLVMHCSVRRLKPGSASELLQVTEPITVGLSGPFDVGARQVNGTSLADGTLEWSWILTPNEPGEKLLQIELPPRSLARLFLPAKSFENLGDAGRESRSRFIVVPLSVGQHGWIGETARNLLLFISWLLGPALAAPWLHRMIERWSQRRAEQNRRRIILQ